LHTQRQNKKVNFGGENPIKVMYNGDWLNKLTKSDMLKIAEHFSVQQLIERDMFQERLKKGESINLREFLYPLLQAYDSVAMDVDLELGGSDQMFNMMAGRMLMKGMKGKDKFVMTMPLLADSKGVKIGKSEGNAIGLTDEPTELFGKIMALPDEAIIPMFTLLTDVPKEEIEKFSIKKDAMDLKKRVARTIVAELNSDEKASEAEESWSNTFQKKEVPEEILEIKSKEKEMLADILVENKVLASKSLWRRLVDEGAISELNSGEKIKDPKYIPKIGESFRIGKHRFIKII
jgi:tyrosyl-tRNA synthetase